MKLSDMQKLQNLGSGRSLPSIAYNPETTDYGPNESGDYFRVFKDPQGKVFFATAKSGKDWPKDTNGYQGCEPEIA